MSTEDDLDYLFAEEHNYKDSDDDKNNIIKNKEIKNTNHNEMDYETNSDSDSSDNNNDSDNISSANQRNSTDIDSKTKEIKSATNELHSKKINSTHSPSLHPQKQINLKKIKRTFSDAFLIKIPGFISIDNNTLHSSLKTFHHLDNSLHSSSSSSSPFPSSFLKEKNLEKALYTIRYERNIASNGNNDYMTNTHIIKWSDGSYSLLIGQNIQFDLHVINNKSPHDYLYAKHVVNEKIEEEMEREREREREKLNPSSSSLLMEVVTKLSKKINIIPFDSHSIITGDKRYLSSKEHEPMALKLALTAEHSKESINAATMAKLKEMKKREKRKISSLSSSRKEIITQKIKTKKYKDKDFEEEEDEDFEDEYDREFIDDNEDQDMTDSDYNDNANDQNNEIDSDNNNDIYRQEEALKSTALNPIPKGDIRKNRKNIARIFDDD